MSPQDQAQLTFLSSEKNVDEADKSKSPDEWRTLARLTAPGAIVRFWCGDPAGDVRLIVDGQPLLECPLDALFTGEHPPFAPPIVQRSGRAGISYVPISYAQSCEIAVRGFTGPWSLAYLTFAHETEVQPLTLPLDPAAAEAAEDVAAVFKDGLREENLFGERPGAAVGAFDQLDSGQKLEIETHRGGGVIRALYVGLPDRRTPADPYALHRCVLRITFDDAAVPAVVAPLADFFGSPFSPEPYRGLLLGTRWETTMPGAADRNALIFGADTGPPDEGETDVEGRFLYCFFPMPYRDRARVEIENLSEERISMTLWAQVDRTPPDRLPQRAPAAGEAGGRTSARAGRTDSGDAPEFLTFHARFVRAFPAPNVVELFDAAAPARLVGLTLGVDSMSYGWAQAAHLQIRQGGKGLSQTRHGHQSLLNQPVASFFGRFEFTPAFDPAPAGLAAEAPPQSPGLQAGQSAQSAAGAASGAPANSAGALCGAPRLGPFSKYGLFRCLTTDSAFFTSDLAVNLTLTADLAPGRKAPPRGAAGRVDEPTYVGAVVYWYADPARVPPPAALTLADLTPPGLRIPGAIEAETYLRGDDWGNVLPQKYAGGVELSADAAANITADGPVELRLPPLQELRLPAASNGRYTLALRVHPRRPFERIEIQTAAGQPIGVAQYARESEGLYAIGLVTLQPGDNALRLHCIPKAVVDCLIIAPQRD